MIFYSVHFNRPDFIPIQKECVENFADGKLVILNNGPKRSISEACKKNSVICHNIKVPYFKKIFLNPSKSHAYALNKLEGIIDYSDDWCIIDHDLFPLKKIEFINFDILSIIQSRPLRDNYLWPGFIAGEKSISLKEIDFSPSPGMDTGAGTSELLKKGYKIKSLREDYIVNENKNNLQQSSILVNLEDYAIHYLNGSNWMTTDENIIEKKNEMLLNFLENKKLFITNAKN